MQSLLRWAPVALLVVMASGSLAQQSTNAQAGVGMACAPSLAFDWGQ
jgi:hypothetical protein